MKKWKQKIKNKKYKKKKVRKNDKLAVINFLNKTFFQWTGEEKIYQTDRQL